MTISELASMMVAVLSLLISLFIILRDRRARRIEVLIRCYSRLIDEHNKRPAIPPSMRGTAEEGDADLELEIMTEQEHDVTLNIERELDTTCYLLLKGQLPKRMFFDLFGAWLMSRLHIWPSVRKENIVNHRFTWQAIQYYDKRKYFIKKQRAAEAIASEIAKGQIKH